MNGKPYENQHQRNGIGRVRKTKKLVEGFRDRNLAGKAVLQVLCGARY